MKEIGSKWIFKTKPNPDGSKRYKARLVIIGFEQTDYGEIYAPISKLVGFRMIVLVTSRG
jgi:hypothetical protein